jgi:hypothetical protein
MLVPAKPMTHGALASSLAKFLSGRCGDYRITWENLEFAEWSAGNSYQCRPDVFSIKPALRLKNCQPWTHEVKATRADFFSDLRSGKWQNYRRFSCRVFFAVPEGLVQPNEVPEGCGLWVYDGTQPVLKWRLVKEASFCRGWTLTERHLLKLILGRWGTRASNLLPLTG